jgi:hypothetical protein
LRQQRAKISLWDFAVISDDDVAIFGTRHANWFFVYWPQLNYTK